MTPREPYKSGGREAMNPRVSYKPGGDKRLRSGRIGEEAAAAWMRSAGFRLLESNWRCREGELDLIAMEGDALVVTEVRSLRQNSRFGNALESLDSRKQHQVRKVARHYLQLKGWQERNIRFDAAAVTLNAAGDDVVEVAYIRNAF